MINLPHKLSPGDPPPNAAWFNSLLEAVAARTPVAGAGIAAAQTSQGTTLRTIAVPPQAPRPVPAAASRELRYLSPILTTMPAPSPLPEGYVPIPAWSVTPGLINDREPDTQNGTVGATTDPRDWAVPITAAGYILAKATANADGSAFERYEVVFMETPPETDPFPDTYCVLGKIYITTAADGTVTRTVSTFNAYHLYVFGLGEAFVWEVRENYFR